MVNLNDKIDNLLNNRFISSDEINEYIDNNFNYDEIKVILYNDLLDNYLNTKIKVNIKNKKVNYIETEFGTLTTFKDISNEIEELSLKEFYSVVNNIDYDNNNYYYNYYYHKLLFIKYIEAIYYYNALKDKNDNYLINMQKKQIYPLIVPLELIKKIKPSATRDYCCKLDIIKMCIEDNFDFTSNMELMFATEITSKNPNKNNYIEEHMREFKKFIYDNRSNIFATDGFKYLAKFYKEELDDNYLTALYKQSPVFFRYFNEYFNDIAHSIINNSPIVNLDKEKKVHLVYNKYDLYNNRPSIYVSEIADDFEVRFIKSNPIIVKLYKIYFEKYEEKTNEDKHNLKDFVRTLLLNPNYFNSVVNNINFSLNEIEEFIMFSNDLDEQEQEKFKLFFKQYQKQEREKWINIHNELVKNKDDKEILNEILNKYHLNNNNSYKRVFNNKFMNNNMKEFVLQCMNPNKIRVFDIIEIIDEMVDRELTIEEILKEKNITKKIFDIIYKNSCKKNPFLHEYIKEGLAKNKKRGFIKLLRFGYAVLESGLKSYNEYRNKFSNIEFDELLRSLEKTELYDKLNELKDSWEDYIENKKVIK